MRVRVVRVCARLPAVRATARPACWVVVWCRAVWACPGHCIGVELSGSVCRLVWLALESNGGANAFAFVLPLAFPLGLRFALVVALPSGQNVSAYWALECQLGFHALQLLRK